MFNIHEAAESGHWVVRANKECAHVRPMKLIWTERAWRKRLHKLPDVNLRYRWLLLQYLHMICIIIIFNSTSIVNLFRLDILNQLLNHIVNIMIHKFTHCMLLWIMWIYAYSNLWGKRRVIIIRYSHKMQTKETQVHVILQSLTCLFHVKV